MAGNSVKFAKSILYGVAAISGLVSAFLWMKSTSVKVPYKEKPDSDGLISAAIISNGKDVIETAEKQIWWSKWAAFFAAIAAFCQAVALLLPDN